MNIIDIRRSIMVHMAASDLLQCCLIDKMSYQVCCDKQFQKNWFLMQHVDAYYSMTLFNFLNDVNEFKKIDVMMEQMKQGVVLQAITTKGNSMNYDVRVIQLILSYDAHHSQWSLKKEEYHHVTPPQMIDNKQIKKLLYNYTWRPLWTNQ